MASVEIDATSPASAVQSGGSFKARWSNLLFTESTGPWRPAFENVHVDVGSLQVVDAQDLDTRWPVIPRQYGGAFEVIADHGTVRLAMNDQGRQVRGVRDSLGIGLKICNQPFVKLSDHSQRHIVVSAGANLLTFVLVARWSGLVRRRAPNAAPGWLTLTAAFALCPGRSETCSTTPPQWSRSSASAASAARPATAS